MPSAPQTQREGTLLERRAAGEKARRGDSAKPAKGTMLAIPKPLAMLGAAHAPQAGVKLHAAHVPPRKAHT
ncbi:Uncharacterised protein [Actinobaculum suis]|uniref:Uncharacterized protein n=1 Tax=Actinobaculum suis TaxID=1657 RepID=A0A1B9BEM6_9ACTO|nr:hypothetical protein ACU20_03610 [Actinobaculum suis]OCA96104.1 hypothetical protein ACU21_02645 [Actinobaculum suis]VDG76972.1 Uncharacterised protein [Actinobaculum suis]